MAEFASAAMFRVIISGMQRMGLKPPPLPRGPSATIPLDAKQQLLFAVQRQLGDEALLKLGQGVHDNLGDSLFPILIHPGQPFKMLAAWQRLERYIHSKHRIQQVRLGPNSVKHEHLSISKDTQPSAQEDLVVMGVLIALLERSQCSQIEAKLSNGLSVWPIASTNNGDPRLTSAIQQRSTRCWTIHWELPKAGVEESPDLYRLNSASLLSKEVIKDKVQKGPFAKQVRAQLDRNLGTAISIEELATSLGTSPRTLQRRLTEEGTRFVDVIGAYRAEQAARLLAYTQESLAHIGFAAGYSDQAHFSRDFLRRVGLRPQQYRDHLSF
jgi:AraC-like DNA-binding protein